MVVVVRGKGVGGWGGGCYKQLNDLITSHGSSEVIAAYGENHSGKLSDFILQRLVVGGGKFCKVAPVNFLLQGP